MFPHIFHYLILYNLVFIKGRAITGKDRVFFIFKGIDPYGIENLFLRGRNWLPTFACIFRCIRCLLSSSFFCFLAYCIRFHIGLNAGISEGKISNVRKDHFSLNNVDNFSIILFSEIIFWFNARRLDVGLYYVFFFPSICLFFDKENKIYKKCELTTFASSHAGLYMVRIQWCLHKTMLFQTAEMQVYLTACIV